MQYKDNYADSPDYDTTREWLRLLAAVTCLSAAAAVVYPIYIGLECLGDMQDGSNDISECKYIFTPAYAFALIAGAVIGEVILIFLLCYACRHEFCGVKRRYETNFNCCYLVDKWNSPVVIHPSAARMTSDLSDDHLFRNMPWPMRICCRSFYYLQYYY